MYYYLPFPHEDCEGQELDIKWVKGIHPKRHWKQQQDPEPEEKRSQKQEGCKGQFDDNQTPGNIYIQGPGGEKGPGRSLSSETCSTSWNTDPRALGRHQHSLEGHRGLGHLVLPLPIIPYSDLKKEKWILWMLQVYREISPEIQQNWNYMQLLADTEIQN